MLAKQIRHINEVLNHVYGTGTLPLSGVDACIAESWRRCVHRHGLNPEEMNEALILPDNRLREHQEAIGDFTDIARYGLQALWKQIRDMGYVVLVADAYGVVVDSLCSGSGRSAWKQAGLYLGALWNERQNGTSAVGMVLETGEPAVVHRNDHFDATHISLSCTAAPVFDSQNRLRAVLDVSALTPVAAKQSQYWVLQLVKHFSALIETAAFIRNHKQDWLIRLGHAAEFLDVTPEYLLAVNDEGSITGANHAFHQWFGLHAGSPEQILIGSNFEQLSGGQSLPGLCGTQNRRPTLHFGGFTLFAGITPPPRKPATPRSAPPLPPELAKLCSPDSRFNQILQRVAGLTDTNVPVLINGETGSGKELLARAIHLSGNRAGKPFIAVNCAAIPESLIESELYGYAPGSFSGADRKGKTGLIQAADGGTLFLDEIGDMPLYLQSRLLRVLSEREVMPVGSVRAVKVDIRIIAATHHDLQANIAAGKFREDLYYRLNGLNVALPSLRERDDFDYTLQTVLQHVARNNGLPPKPVSDEAMNIMRRYRWPGNIRQLANALEVALHSAKGAQIQPEDLPDYLCAQNRPSENPPASTKQAQNSKAILQSPASLQNALQAADGCVSRLARDLGVSRMTVYRYLKKHGTAE